MPPLVGFACPPGGRIFGFLMFGFWWFWFVVLVSGLVLAGFVGLGGLWAVWLASGGGCWLAWGCAVFGLVGLASVSGLAWCCFALSAWTAELLCPPPPRRHLGSGVSRRSSRPFGRTVLMLSVQWLRVLGLFLWKIKSPAGLAGLVARCGPVAERGGQRLCKPLTVSASCGDLALMRLLRGLRGRY